MIPGGRAPAVCRDGPTRRLARGQGGLVGRSLVILLLIIVVAGVALVEGGSILFATIQIDDVAGAAAAEGASVLNRTNSSEMARAAAIEEVRRWDPEARLTRFRFSPEGEVTVTVKREAATMLVHRIGFLEHLAVVRATKAAPPPTI